MITFKPDHFGELKLHELISWSVQEEFSNNPFNGWIQDLNCAIAIKTSNASAQPVGSVEAGDKDQIVPQEQISVQKLIEETSDKIILEKLLQRERANYHEDQAKDGTA